MGIANRFNFFVFINILVGIVVAASFTLSWKKITLALDRVEYAETINDYTFQLQLHFLTEEISPLNSNTLWIQNHKLLSRALIESPVLDAPQLILHNSISSKTDSLLILYRQLQRLNTTEQTLEIRTLLKSRMLMQLESIVEDSFNLSQIARKDIRSTLQTQLVAVVLSMGLGLIILFFGAHRISRIFRRAIAELQKGVQDIEKGRFEHIEIVPGAEDFSAFVKQFNHISEKLEKTTVTRDVLQQIVDERTAVLKEIANTDPLTQVANRRALFDRGEMEFNRANRHKMALSVLMLDCDWFKKINDRFGHPVGDKLLIHLCQICRRVIREEDFIARYGGEEFVILLPHCDRVAGMEKAENIRKAIALNPLYKDEQKIEFTVSIGVASQQINHQNFEQLMADADKALLLAKEHGRNCVEVY